MVDIITAQQAQEDEALQITQEGINHWVEAHWIEPIIQADGVYYERTRLIALKQLEAKVLRNTRPRRNDGR